MLADFGMCADVVVRTDSSSGLAVGSRRGLGHVQTLYLWVQQRVQEGDLRLKEEPGDTNVSDALTKPLDEKRTTNLLTMMCCVTRSEEGAQHWRRKRSDEFEVDQNCSSSTAFRRVFWKHDGILERDGRPVLGVAAYWVGCMQVFVKTLTSKSIRDGK